MTPDKDKLLVARALEDTTQWMAQARDEIDALFGANHAKNNPHLVAMFMRVAAMNCQTMIGAQRAAQGLDELGRLIDILSRLRAELPTLIGYAATSQPAPKKSGKTR